MMPARDNQSNIFTMEIRDASITSDLAREYERKKKTVVLVN